MPRSQLLVKPRERIVTSRHIVEWMQEVDPDRWPIIDAVDLAAMNAQLADALPGT